jgi:type I restriction enzyme, S subunit
MKTVEARVTETGGRKATTRHIPPKLALAVGMPSTPPAKRWRWTQLTDVARLESGHTPSRQHPEWWGGSIPWVGIQDARAHHGRRIDDTLEHTNDLGIEHSSARVLPTDTVCLSRTASVGYVVVMGRPMATSQDFVNWVCSEHLDHNFLKYLFIAEGDALLRFASGAVHQTIYFPEVKAFHVCHPPLSEQRRIVGILDEALEGVATATANAEKNLRNARALFDSHLQSVFTQHGKGWTFKSISEVATHSLGKMLDKAKNRGELKPYLRNLNVRWFTFDLSDLREMRFLPEESARCTAVKGDVLICEGGYPGRAAIWDEDYPIYFQKALHRVRFDEPDHGRWLLYYLYAQDRSGGLKQHFSGAGIQHLTGEALARFELPLPPPAELRRSLAKFEDLSVESLRLEGIYQQKCSALDMLKKSLLHQAFTGNL